MSRNTVIYVLALLSLFGFARRSVADWPGECTYEWTSCAKEWVQYYINNNYCTIQTTPPHFNGTSYIWPSQTMSTAGEYYWTVTIPDCYVMMEYWQPDPYYTYGGYWARKAQVVIGSGRTITSFDGSDGMGFNTENPKYAYPEGCPDCSQQRADLAAQCGGEEYIINWDSFYCTGDCDECPDNFNKTEPGICGCGVPDTDTDGDGTPDCNDGCPEDPTTTDFIKCIAEQNLGECQE